MKAILAGTLFSFSRDPVAGLPAIRSRLKTMKALPGGCRVYSAADGQASTAGTWTARLIISRQTGAKQITQAVNEYAPGLSPVVVNPNAEEVLYVAAGEGICRCGAAAQELRSGTAVYIPPGAAYSIENTGLETLRVVSACCPEDPDRHVTAELGEAKECRAVHEDDREVIRAGADREFRYLAHTDLGCRQVTQFVGWIPSSKAPLHLHPYEEAIYILDGHGILHLEGNMSASEFGPGDSIYLRDGVLHCLENPGPAPIRLLGVFHPSGSPGVAYEDD
ncbi:MAG TPA: cupin domain-containing protein [Bryobacteraceae bacterium]|nr:cupin domain-containing protein [Bryobacteraceae bacterium]